MGDMKCLLHAVCNSSLRLACRREESTKKKKKIRRTAVKRIQLAVGRANWRYFVNTELCEPSGIVDGHKNTRLYQMRNLHAVKEHF